MNKEVDCQVFGDQLDGLVRGDLPEEGKRQLRLHADTCPACAMLLRVQEHLVDPSLEELEARVPEELLASVWAGVAGGVGGVGGEGRRPLPSFGWLIPTLAAATIVLLLSTGFLILEMGRLRDRGAVLAQQVAEQQRWLSVLEVGADADPVARTAALAGRNPWLKVLSRQENISIRGLQLLLERMPGDRVVLTQAQLDAALRSRTPLSIPLLRDALAGIESRDGVRVRDLIEALDGLGVGPDVAVPTADLVSLLS